MLQKVSILENALFVERRRKMTRRELYNLPCQRPFFWQRDEWQYRH